jgi:two-component system phosphate regulon sensor histidine kinase PhoR
MAHVRPLSGEGAGLVLLVFHDLTPLHRVEEMRADFVANASHELRTPLAAIIGYAETLADEPDLEAPLRTQFGATIRGEARRMLRIIEDLMSLSRIQADRFVAPAERVDLREVIAASIANSSAARRGLPDIAASLPDDLPLVRGDEPQLIQLVDNLLSNALRYGCDKGGSAIEVTAEQRRKRVLLTIRDHGPGIAREHLPRVTERFYRVDAARSRETGGTGLGLAIVKHIVERHRGTLEIDSTVGVGTTVRVALPIAR